MGQFSSVSIRGAKTEQTLVLLDGVPMNDPSNPGRSFDFGSLSTDNVEKIEVVRGPQSTVYGSNAMGGVINIITREGRPSKKPVFNVSGGLEAGGYDLKRGNLCITGGAEKIGYSLGISTTSAGLVSAAGEKYGNLERDPYSNTDFYGKVKLEPSKRLNVDLLFKNSDTTSDFDAGGGPFAEAVGYWSRNKQSVYRGEIGYALIEKKWDSKFVVSASEHDRSVYGSPFNPPGFVERYKGQTYNYAWHNVIRMGSHSVTTGLTSEQEKAVFTDFDPLTFAPMVAPEKSAHINSFYLQDNFEIGKNFASSVGFRHDSHSTAGSKTTYRASANYHLVSGVHLKGSYGTGFKAPTLYQLYSSFGNTALMPETSQGWDAGVEFRSKDQKHLLGVTYFSNNLDNLIDFDTMTFTFFNVNRATTRGIEAYGRTRLHPRLALNANYTYLKSRDENTGLELLRRPRNKLMFGVKYDVIPEKGYLYADVINVGARKDMDFSVFPSVLIDLPPYTLVNATFSYKLTKETEAFIRGENIFNQQYENVWGYGYPGASLSGGVRFRF
jgi:vitamin B12 transporter